MRLSGNVKASNHQASKLLPSHNAYMRALAITTAVIFGLAAPVAAQEPQEPPKPKSVAAPEIDATKLGVSLSRIQKGLRVAEARDASNPSGLRLEFNVQVYGVAPRIDVIPDGEDLVYGAVHGTAPSHPQLLE